jgi:alkylated DNA nucleotide flippase Atl1
MSPEQEAYVERVLSLVEAVPPGRVTTYGTIAEHLGGGARRVGTIMALHGGGVPWWRVVRADGSLPPSHQDRAREQYVAEGTPVRGERVDIATAYWDPAD